MTDTPNKPDGISHQPANFPGDGISIGGRSLEEVLGLHPGLLRPDSTPEEIERKARESVARAVEYFREQGIDLGYIPKVKYRDGTHPIIPSAGAAVNAEIMAHRNVLNLHVAALLKLVYSKFGLRISDEAIAETIEVGKQELETMFPDGTLGDEADIYLFSPIKNFMESMDETMVHEIWHLIEKKFGVLAANDIIHEGTATYVQNRFAGRDSRWMGTETDFFGVLYHNAAHIVQEEVNLATQPLQAILYHVKRQAIADKFNKRVLPLFYQKVVEEFGSSSTLDAFARDVVNKHPAYAAFRRDPTKENLLAATKQRGYVKAADELAGQNLTGVLEYYRGLLHNVGQHAPQSDGFPKVG